MAMVRFLRAGGVIEQARQAKCSEHLSGLRQKVPTGGGVFPLVFQRRRDRQIPRAGSFAVMVGTE
jgi:hypothetical protein